MHFVDFVENALFKSFADHRYLLRFLTSSRSMKEIATASFQED
jgi:hypothetical protein